MDYLETLARWQELKQVIPQLVAEERALREGLFGGTFPKPKEGVNKFNLPDGRVLKASYPIQRDFVKDVFAEHELILPELDVGGLPFDLWASLVKAKFSLDLKGYRELENGQQSAFDRLLVIKPGLPTLEIVEAKE